MPDRPAPILLTLGAWAVVVLGIEAIGRRHFWRYFVSVALLILVLLLVAAFAWSVIVWGWRYAIAGTFLTLAILLLIANIQELGRD